MTKSIRVFGYRFTFTFNHRFKKNIDILDKMTLWKDYRLGLWFKTYMAVSKPANRPAVLGEGGAKSRAYVIGMDLIIVKIMMEVCYRPLVINIK